MGKSRKDRWRACPKCDYILSPGHICPHGPKTAISTGKHGTHGPEGAPEQPEYWDRLEDGFTWMTDAEYPDTDDCGNPLRYSYYYDSKKMLFRNQKNLSG